MIGQINGKNRQIYAEEVILPLLKCGLHAVTTFQSVQHGKRYKKNVTFQRRNLTNYLCQVIKINISSSVMLILRTFYMM